MKLWMSPDRSHLTMPFGRSEACTAMLAAVAPGDNGDEPLLPHPTMVNSATSAPKILGFINSG
jgi:hypothetical protein